MTTTDAESQSTTGPATGLALDMGKVVEEGMADLMNIPHHILHSISHSSGIRLLQGQQDSEWAALHLLQELQGLEWVLLRLLLRRTLEAAIKAVTQISGSLRTIVDTTRDVVVDKAGDTTDITKTGVTIDKDGLDVACTEIAWATALV
jgi:hypothetical protein